MSKETRVGFWIVSIVGALIFLLVMLGGIFNWGPQ